jgi:antitoxin component of RelBE/YafQ-DinJ toxin-antitoxin module
MSSTSQVIVNVDSKLKSLAMKKAKSEGLPFSSVLKFAIKAFVDGDIEVGLVENFNKKTRREIVKAEKDFSKGKNLSPRFSTVDEMIAHLKRQ